MNYYLKKCKFVKKSFMQFTPLQSLGRLFSSFRGKDNYTQTRVMSLNQIYDGKQPQYVSISNEEAHLFNTTAELQAVITRKGAMYSNGVIKHYKTVGAKVVEVENSPIVKLLENPNPLQSRNEWMMEELLHTSLFGNSFVYGIRPFSTAEPKVMYNLPADRMKVIPTGKIYNQYKLEDIIKEYILRNYDGTEQPYEVKDVIHSRVTDPANPILGQSPLHALQMAISNIRGAYGYRNVLITQRGAVGMLSNEARDGDSGGGIPLNDKERKRIEEQYLKDYGTSDRQSKVMLTSSSLKWTPFTYPTKDLMLFEEINADFQKIIDVYGMKKELFSEDKSATFSNLLEAKKMTYQDTIIPYAEDFAYKLTQYLGLDLKGEWISIDYSHIEALQDNENLKAEMLAKKADAYNKLKQAGGFDDKELRLLLGL
jgi:phage portal protein BeeE